MAFNFSANPAGAAPAASGFSFGGAPAPTTAGATVVAAPSTSLFGSNPTPPTPAGGLFGGSAPGKI